MRMLKELSAKPAREALLTIFLGAAQLLDAEAETWLRRSDKNDWTAHMVPRMLQKCLKGSTD